MAWLLLAVALLSLGAGAVLVWRRPIRALYIFIVGLALHNTVFILLFAAGLTGWQLTIAQAWKEILLGVVVVRIGLTAARDRALPFRPAMLDAVGLAWCAVALIYAIVPQGWLGGAAGPTAELYGLRHYLLPVALFFVGRALVPARADLQRVLVLVLATGAVTAVVGIVEEYTVSLERWRELGVAGYYRDQLSFAGLRGPAGLPDNFVLNSADGVLRRLVSLFVSPLASAYCFVVVLALAAAGAFRSLPRRVVLAGAALTAAGLLFSFTRSAVLGLAGGLLVLAAATRRGAPALLAVGTLGVALAFAAVFAQIAPRTHFFPEDEPFLLQGVSNDGGPTQNGPLQSSVRLSDASSEAHLSSLRKGGDRLLHHPQGHGIGNSGETAVRFGVPLQAGESYYLEVGADMGIPGLLAWLAFCGLALVTLATLAARAGSTERALAAGLLAACAGLSAIGVLTDVWGNPWPTYVLWWLVGSVVTLNRA